jgi:hypothetical protein
MKIVCLFFYPGVYIFGLDVMFEVELYELLNSNRFFIEAFAELELLD